MAVRNFRAPAAARGWRRDRMPRGHGELGRLDHGGPPRRHPGPAPQGAHAGPQRGHAPRRVAAGPPQVPAELQAGARRVPRHPQQAPRAPPCCVWVPRLVGGTATAWLPVLDQAGAFLRYVRGDALHGLDQAVEQRRRGRPILFSDDAPPQGPWVVLGRVRGQFIRFNLVRHRVPPAAARLNQPVVPARREEGREPAAPGAGHVPDAPRGGQPHQRRLPPAQGARRPNNQGTGRRATRSKRNLERAFVAVQAAAPAAAAVTPVAAAAAGAYEEDMRARHRAMEKRHGQIEAAVARLAEIENTARATGKSPTRATVRAIQDQIIKLLRDYRMLEAEANHLCAAIVAEGGAPLALPRDLQERPVEDLLPASVRRCLAQHGDLS